MPSPPKEKKDQREKLSMVILIGSLLVIVAVGTVAIILKPAENSITIFNMILPMVATWVGTILAFYFGRENFESASRQVQNMASKMSKEPSGGMLVTAVMKPFDDMIYYQIVEGKSEADITLEVLQQKLALKDKASRIPIVDENKVLRYMIHESSINKYLASGKTKTDTLKQFLDWWMKEYSVEFIFNKAFIIVPEKTALNDANEKMEQLPYCRDVFVTRGGNPQEPVTGWISNITLLKFLDV
jgi:Na+-transporting NADH:ubiquinone oxidoreductase subunit NqrC